MSVLDQLATRTALRDLKATPLVLLANTKVTAGGLPGIDSASGRMCLSLTANHLRIGSRNFVTIGGAPADSVITCQMIYTPMRTNVMVGRTAATQRIQPGLNELWVTTRQTGCTVLVLDWGAAGQANYYLRQDVTAVATATGGGVAPQRYLLVQSGYTNALGHLLSGLGRLLGLPPSGP